jgi:hypothetical protein
MDERLDPDRLGRVHRSHIVNLECIRELHPLVIGVNGPGVSRAWRGCAEASASNIVSNTPTPRRAPRPAPRTKKPRSSADVGAGRPGGSGFGTLKSLTYLILYSSSEDRKEGDGSGRKLESIDYWSG